MRRLRSTELDKKLHKRVQRFKPLKIIPCDAVHRPTIYVVDRTNSMLRERKLRCSRCDYKNKLEVDSFMFLK